MKHPFLMCLAALACCSMFSGCGAVIFGAPDSATEEQTEESEPVVQEQEEEQQAFVDCDAFMQQLADTCFATTAFDADGTTPLHIFDETGNDLGEVDQEWAAGYCECYAQLAFQTFGCTTVISHENLDDEAYAQTYEEISNACATVDENTNAADEQTDAAQTDAAQTDAAQTDAAQTDAAQTDAAQTTETTVPEAEATAN